MNFRQENRPPSDCCKSPGYQRYGDTSVYRCNTTATMTVFMKKSHCRTSQPRVAISPRFVNYELKPEEKA